MFGLDERIASYSNGTTLLIVLGVSVLLGLSTVRAAATLGVPAVRIDAIMSGENHLPLEERQGALDAGGALVLERCRCLHALPPWCHVRPAPPGGTLGGQSPPPDGAGSTPN